MEKTISHAWAFVAVEHGNVQLAMAIPWCPREGIKWDLQVLASITFRRGQAPSCEVHLQGGQHNISLFDHLVRSDNKTLRYIKPKHLGSL
jgi:hypothetical protein